MRRLKLYLETTIPNYLLADDAPREREITQALFEEIKQDKYEVYTSRLVFAEIEATPDKERRRKLLEFIEGIPILEVNPRCEEIAKTFLDEGVIPELTQL